MLPIDNIDDHIDDTLATCLTANEPKSFFLFAGAGSGKTRSLVNSLMRVKEARGRQLRLRNQEIAVITFTNAACDEIKRRLEFDPLVRASTIHSFMWEMIQGFNVDIRDWLETTLKADIEELSTLILKGRPGTKVAIERERSLVSKKKRLEHLHLVSKFTYSPTGENKSRDSLNHSEVIKIGADFLLKKPLMQKLLINKYPILLVDESQDTNKHLMDALLEVQKNYGKQFALGLFGDTMQRIYSDGKVDLGVNLPEDWQKPAKRMNHRCPRRVIQLINKIRSAVDSQEQIPRSSALDGSVRLFIVPTGGTDKSSIEVLVRDKMAQATGDERWREDNQVKTLILEHLMAARRMGFFEMYEPLNSLDGLKQGLREGTIPFLIFFSEIILPLIKAKRLNDNFALAAVVRKNSPLLHRDALKALGSSQVEQMKLVNKAVNEVTDLFKDDADPKFLQVLQCVAKNGLFEIPEAIYPFAHNDEPTVEEIGEDNVSEFASAIRRFLEAPFSQIEVYTRYLKGDGPFGTHQGVKGLEFKRVFVILDDEEAGGFLFSYEKLFGAKEKTKTDTENETAGKETGIDRTRRLFYVTCSRSEDSLAILAYSENPEKVKQHAIEQKWFDASEVEIL